MKIEYAENRNGTAHHWHVYDSGTVVKDLRTQRLHLVCVGEHLGKMLISIPDGNQMHHLDHDDFVTVKCKLVIGEA